MLDFNSTLYSGGNPYSHDMTVTGDEATGGWPASGSHTNSWNATVTVASNDVTIVAEYEPGSGVYPYTFTAVGTLAADGTLSGTWTDTLDDSGTWSSFSGAAMLNCEGKGEFHYSDANDNWYDVDIQYVNVVDDKAYFAGPVVAASNAGWLSNWLSAAVEDNGEPAYGVDKIWGIFTDMSTAKYNVGFQILPLNPGSDPGPYIATSGNLQVHTYD